MADSQTLKNSLYVALFLSDSKMIYRTSSDDPIAL